MNDPVSTRGESAGSRLPALILPLSTLTASIPDVEVITVDAATNLPGLAQAVNDAHAQVEHHGRSMIEGAVRAGNALIEAKATVDHGGFKEWVEENCRCSYRSARRYMQVARITSGELASSGHFDEGVSAFLTKHRTTGRTKLIGTQPQERDAEQATVIQPTPVVVEANEVTTTAPDALPPPQPDVPAAPPEERWQIMTLNLNTVANVEAVLVQATSVHKVSLELSNTEIFKAREAIIMQLSSIQHDDLLELLASTLLKVGIACSASA